MAPSKQTTGQAEEGHDRTPHRLLLIGTPEEADHREPGGHQQQNNAEGSGAGEPGVEVPDRIEVERGDEKRGDARDR
ncbi:hypothetical protein [Streptomyces monomycini]|uniref:hypothetical protein n=1 Tax=Streptomyces monomycini TaxID=371720 RepID=UPI001EEBC88D|nr:hypothetical protein [Streptomyces monomycini]